MEADGRFGGLWDYRTRGVPDLRTASMVYTPRPKTCSSSGGRTWWSGTRTVSGISPRNGPSCGITHSWRSLDNPNDNLGPMFYDERTGELVLYSRRILRPRGGDWCVTTTSGRSRRNLGRMTTRDGVNWHRSYIWAPPREHPKHQSYGMQRVKQIGDLYVAFFPLYDCETQQMDVHIWVSRNGIHWEDVGGDQAWIPNGPDGSFDHGIVYSLIDGPVEGDRSEAFYHGTNTLHFNAWILSRLRGDWMILQCQPPRSFDENTYNGRPYLSPPAPVGPGWAMYDCFWSWRRPRCSQDDGGNTGGLLAELEANTGRIGVTTWRRAGSTKSCRSGWSFAPMGSHRGGPGRQREC